MCHDALFYQWLCQCLHLYDPRQTLCRCANRESVIFCYPFVRKATGRGTTIFTSHARFYAWTVFYLLHAPLGKAKRTALVLIIKLYLNRDCFWNSLIHAFSPFQFYGGSLGFFLPLFKWTPLRPYEGLAMLMS